MRGNRINEFDYIEKDNDFCYEDNPSSYDSSIRTFYGYINRQGEYAIKPKYQEAELFRNGLAIVKIDNKYGIIDKTGTYIVEPQFDEDNFIRGIDRIDSQDRIFKVFKNGRYGFIDRYGHYIIKPKFPSTRIRGVVDDTIEIIGDNDKFGFIDINGNIIAKPQFDCVEEFSEGCVRVQMNGKYGFVDKEGNYIAQPIYDDAQRQFAEGRAWVCLDNKYGLIDNKGRFVTERVYDGGGRFWNGLAPVCINGKWGVIDTEGKLIIPLEYDDVSVIWNYPGFARVKSNSKYGIVSTQNRTIIEPEYDYIEFYQDGIFVVGIKEKKEIDEGALPFDDTVWKYGLIDINGKVLAPPIYIYDRAKVDRMEFHEGLAAVCVNGKWGYINARGEMVIKPQFEHADNFCKGIAYIKENGRYGLIDKSGRVVEDPQYSNISTKINNGYIRGENCNGKWGIIDTEGHTVVESRHEYIFGDISEGMARIQQVESFGFANCRNGNIIAPVFNYVYEFSEGLAVVRLTEEQLNEHSISSDRTD